MEGMLVDEYGSNSSIQFPGFCMPPMLSDADGGSDSDGGDFEAVTPEHNGANLDGGETTPKVEKRSHFLEDVDGELEWMLLRVVNPKLLPQVILLDQIAIITYHFIHLITIVDLDNLRLHRHHHHLLHIHLIIHHLHFLLMRIIIREITENPGRGNLICLESIQESRMPLNVATMRISILNGNQGNCLIQDVFVHPMIKGFIHPILILLHPTNFHIPKNRGASHEGTSHLIAIQTGLDYATQVMEISIGISTEIHIHHRKVVRKSIGVRHLHPHLCYDNGSRMAHAPMPPSYPPNKPALPGSRRRVPPWLMNIMQFNPCRPPLGGPVPVGNRGPSNWKSR